jgi:hypothetical protein
MARSAIIAVALLAALGAAVPAGAAGDHPVRLALRNDGAVPLHCRLMFGHWVDRDLGTLPPGGGVALAVTQQASDGALYVLRDDGQRRMMIESILCGRGGAAPAELGRIDLAPARSARPDAIEAACGAPDPGGAVGCRRVRLTP